MRQWANKVCEAFAYQYFFCFDFRKSLTPFGVLISDEDFGQVLLKSAKSTYSLIEVIRAKKP